MKKQKIKIQHLSETLADYRKIIHRDGFARVYFDAETGETWTNEYSDGNSYTRYDNEDIIEITPGYCELSSMDNWCGANVRDVVKYIRELFPGKFYARIYNR